MPGIVLIGYRGTGKTSTAEILADRLGVPLLDGDRMVESSSGKTIARIFAEEGESSFRDRETDVLAETAARSDFFVLATGGGAVIREENRRLLRQIADGMAMEVGNGIRRNSDNGSEQDARRGRDRGTVPNGGQGIGLTGAARKKSERSKKIGCRGGIVWLTARAETIAVRLAADSHSAAQRPALTNLSPTGEIRSLLKIRDPFYREIADLTLDADEASPMQIAEAILAFFRPR